MFDFLENALLAKEHPFSNEKGVTLWETIESAVYEWECPDGRYGRKTLTSSTKIRDIVVQLECQGMKRIEDRSRKHGKRSSYTIWLFGDQEQQEINLKLRATGNEKKGELIGKLAPAEREMRKVDRGY